MLEAIVADSTKAQQIIEAARASMGKQFYLMIAVLTFKEWTFQTLIC